MFAYRYEVFSLQPQNPVVAAAAGPVALQPPSSSWSSAASDVAELPEEPPGGVTLSNEQFMGDHPEFSRNLVYISGISYCGIIVLKVTLQLYEDIKRGDQPVFNIQVKKILLIVSVRSMKKAAAASKRGGKPAAAATLAKAAAISMMNDSSHLDNLPNGIESLMISGGTCTGVLCSHPICHTSLGPSTLPTPHSSLVNGGDVTPTMKEYVTALKNID
ncbi:hypothetical protein L1987_57747 [Smallanthus sonchifolius]|uniref:Uncharacterized protein n=1 Tax=Smallanthus sonchifolius TaxID=185202 RepID=A0ACB9DDV5_9ASTR|nr:hypothetical protein L1987_57747 [Smallanthus sonchifolius]